MSAEGRADIARANELVAKAHRRARGDIAVAMQTLALEYAALEARLAEAEAAGKIVNAETDRIFWEGKRLEARLAEAERERDEWKAAAMRSRPGLLRAALPSESGTPTTKGTQ